MIEFYDQSHIPPGGGDSDDRSKDIHVIPTDDIQEHAPSVQCWCYPRRDEDEPRVVLHRRAMDAC